MFFNQEDSVKKKLGYKLYPMVHCENNSISLKYISLVMFLQGPKKHETTCHRLSLDWIKVTTHKKDTIRSTTPKKGPKLDTTCLQFQHKFSKVTNGSWRILWGNQ
jgi:hypothetical protein